MTRDNERWEYFWVKNITKKLYSVPLEMNLHTLTLILHQFRLRQYNNSALFASFASHETCPSRMFSVSYPVGLLNLDLADVEFRVCVKALQCYALSLQNGLGWSFNEQSSCMWTETRAVGYLL